MMQAAVLRPLRFPRDQEAFLLHLRALYPSIAEDTLLRRLDDVEAGGWECIGAFEEGEGRAEVQMLGMSGYWIQNRFCYGRYLYVDHFIVGDDERGRGLGQLLWHALERIARERGCERIVLDTFVTNAVAQRFWMNQGCRIVGLHFGKPLDPAG
ncbi:MAG: GNAT family N-acetyltransferase [Pseudomonadota bacterium]